MIVRRLQWAGAQIKTTKTNVLIDPVYKSPNPSFFGEPLQVFSQMDDIVQIDAILITHLHSDHFDPMFILERFGSDVLLFVPFENEEMVKSKGFLNVQGIKVGDVIELNDVKIVGSYSVDGLGDSQLSWIIKDDKDTVIHCGDTLWHGYWWEISKKYGPFSAALMPVNGAIVHDSDMISSNQPICLNPEQAVSAAKILGAKLLIPIHYGSFHNPPYYFETENVEKRIKAAARKDSVTIAFLQHKEEICLRS